MEDKATPKGSVIIKTILACLIDLILFIGIPYALLSLPQTSTIFVQSGLGDPTFISYLTLFAILIVVLTVVRNFTRPSSIIHLASGLALICSGVIFFFLLGSPNSPAARLGFLTFLVPAQGSAITVTVEFVSLALIWLAVAGLKATNLVLGFIEVRHSKPSLKIPVPPQAALQTASSRPEVAKS